MNIRMTPLFPVIEDEDGCYEHNIGSGSCATCAADAQGSADYREAQRLERQADTIESMTLTDEADREHLRAFANSLRKRASRIMGRLQRLADQEAREAENRANAIHRELPQ